MEKSFRARPSSNDGCPSPNERRPDRRRWWTDVRSVPAIYKLVRSCVLFFWSPRAAQIPYLHLHNVLTAGSTFNSA
jgi:hypothetical protein